MLAHLEAVGYPTYIREPALTASIETSVTTFTFSRWSTVENVHGDFVIHNCLAPAAYLQSWITRPPDKSPYIHWMSV